MQRRAMQVCPCTGCPAHPGSCPELTPGGRCPDCGRQADLARGTAAQRGYDFRWRHTRAAHLRRQPMCIMPGCDEQATDVDHIDGLGPKGPRGHDPDNLRSYCHSHHSQRTARDQPGGFNQR